MKQWSPIETDANYLAACLRGEKLYGDDFTPEQIRQWFLDEENAHFQLGSSDRTKYKYRYHALNKRHGYRLLPNRRFEHALAFGGGYGEELLPVLDKVGSLVIVEPAEGYFTSTTLNGVPVSYVKPVPDGSLPFPDGTFDLITCFGVLHHIPNVSAVLKEIGRLLAPGGYFLFREPVYSMGDWMRPRHGLTPHERGIPAHLLDRFLLNSGMEVVCLKKCMFALSWKLEWLLRRPPFNYAWVAALDEVLCKLPFLPADYHATSRLKKLRAGFVHGVVTKPRTAAV
jgi:SAM-dependent methyltransferase